MEIVNYWDVYPKNIKVSLSEFPVTIPLSVRGEPRGEVLFMSENINIASVSEFGKVTLGQVAGATFVTVYENAELLSARYVQISVDDYGTGGT